MKSGSLRRDWMCAVIVAKSYGRIKLLEGRPTRDWSDTKFKRTRRWHEPRCFLIYNLLASSIGSHWILRNKVQGEVRVFIRAGCCPGSANFRSYVLSRPARILWNNSWKCPRELDEEEEFTRQELAATVYDFSQDRIIAPLRDGKAWCFAWKGAEGREGNSFKTIDWRRVWEFGKNLANDEKHRRKTHITNEWWSTNQRK